MSKLMVHYFDSQTGEYLMSARDGEVNPNEPDMVYIPLNSTRVPPPATGKDEVAIWNIEAQAWSLFSDYRKYTFYSVETKETVRFNLGEVPDADEVTLLVPKPDSVWNPNTREWEPSLDLVKAEKIQEIKFSRWYCVEHGVVEYKGLHFPTDEAAKNAFLFAIASYKEINYLTPAWQAKDGIYEIQSYEDLVELAALPGYYTQEMFARQFAIIPLVMATTSLEEVAAISWDMPIEGLSAAPEIEIPKGNYSF